VLQSPDFPGIKTFLLPHRASQQRPAPNIFTSVKSYGCQRGIRAPGRVDHFTLVKIVALEGQIPAFGSAPKLTEVSLVASDRCVEMLGY
jgi:hypothetical protein